MENENATLMLLCKSQHLRIEEYAVDIYEIDVKLENDGQEAIPKINRLFQTAACIIDAIFPAELDVFLNGTPYVFYLKGVGLFSWKRLHIKTETKDVIRKSIKEAIRSLEQTCLQYIGSDGNEICCQLKSAVSLE